MSDIHSFIVKNLAEKDLLRFVDLWNTEKDILTSSKMEMTTEKALKGFQDKMFDYFGLFLEDELIGFVLVKEDSEAIWIKHFVVNHKYRSKGLGTYLLNHVVKLININKPIKTEVLLENSIAKKFFEKNRFKVEKADFKEGQYILIR